MADVILAIFVLTCMVLILTAGYHLIRRAGQASKFVIYALVAFILISTTGIMTGCSTTNQPTSETSSSNSGLNTTREQQDSTQQENQSQTGNNDKLVNNEATGTLKVHFIDVGQADAILIQFPSGQNMLIDAGNNSDGNLVVKYLKKNGVKKLDHVIGTHPHEDHIGGLDVAVKNFNVSKVYLPRVTHTTKTYEDLLMAIKNKGLKVTEAKGGVKLDVGMEVTAELLAPNSTGYEELNNYSAVLRLSFGNTSFLFTGDAEDVSETEMLRAGYILKANVLKVGHHGSSSSTSSAFLKAVSPKYAVICVGEGNDYGHPHSEILNNLATAGIEVFRTDQQGTIIATSDGNTVTFNKKPSEVKVRPANTETINPKPASSKIIDSNIPTTGSSSGVAIESIDLKAEIVTIKNSSGAAVNISGWRLVSEKGNQEFTFRSGTALAPGETIKIVTGPNAAAGSGVLVWTTENLWNNDSDPGALYDSSGKLVSRYPR